MTIFKVVSDQVGPFSVACVQSLLSHLDIVNRVFVFLLALDFDIGFIYSQPAAIVSKNSFDKLIHWSHLFEFEVGGRANNSGTIMDITMMRPWEAVDGVVHIVELLILVELVSDHNVVFPSRQPMWLLEGKELPRLRKLWTPNEQRISPSLADPTDLSEAPFVALLDLLMAKYPLENISVVERDLALGHALVYG